MAVALSIFKAPTVRRVVLAFGEWILLFVLGLPILTKTAGVVGGDPFYYVDIARYYYQSNSIIVPDNHFLSLVADIRSPLYPLVISLAYRIWGPSITSAFLIAKASAFISLVCVYFIGKSLFGFRTAITTALLISATSYLATFPISLNIDGPQTMFMLVMALLYILAIEKEKVFLAFIAGCSLGLGFQVKESAVVWIVLPLVFFLLESKKRFVFGLKAMVFSGIGFGIVVVSWWVYYYLLTGKFFLSGSIFTTVLDPILKMGFNPNENIFLLSGKILLVVVIFALLGWRLYLFIRKILERSKKLSLILKNVSIYSGVLLLLALLVVFTITITRMATWIYSPAEIIPRLQAFLKIWYDIRVVPDQPLLYYAPFALVLLILLTMRTKNKPDMILLALILAYIPFYIAMGYKGRYSWPIRYLMTIFFLSYLLLARMVDLFVIALVRWAKKIRFARFSQKYQLANVLTIVGMVILCWPGYMSGVFKNETLLATNPNEVWNNEGVLSASSWIKENLPPGSRILSSQYFLVPLDFFTDGQYQWYELFDQGRNSNSQKPIDNENALYNLSDGLHLTRNRGFDINAPITSDMPMYIRFYYNHDFVQIVSNPEDFIPKPIFAVLDQNRLIQSLEQNSIEYVSIVVGNHPLMFNAVPQFFLDSMDLVFYTGWDVYAPKPYPYELYIFKVKDTDLTKPYPVVIEKKTYDTLVKQVQKLSGEDYKEDMVKIFGHRPIQIEPVSVGNIRLYKEMVLAFIAAGEVDNAAVQYSVALADSPELAPQLLTIAESLVKRYPNEAGVHMLLGKIYQTLGDLNKADRSYQQALSLGSDNALVNSIVYLGLGKTSISLGNSQQALVFLEKALEYSYYGGRERQQMQLFAEGDLYQRQGKIDNAIDAYTRAIRMNHITMNSSPTQAKSNAPAYYRTYDLADPGKAEDFHFREGTGSAYPEIFIIDQQPRKVLFAHPPSRISFTVQLNGNSSLRFAPMLSPQVWQIGKGDGVQFDVTLQTQDKVEHQLYSYYLDSKNMLGQRDWFAQLINLDEWVGQTVTLTFSTSCGPNDNCMYDWAAWGELSIVQPVYQDFLEKFVETYGNKPSDQLKVTNLTINDEEREIIFQHPTSQVVMKVTLPAQPILNFGIGMSPEVWSPEKGDGVLYKVYIRYIDKPAVLYRVFSQYIDPKNNPEDQRWIDASVDLSRFGNQQVEIIFETSPGPQDNMDYDWGGWSTPVIIDESVPQSNVAQILGSNLFRP